MALRELSAEDRVLLFDTKLGRPACALLQAAAGVNYHFLCATFPAETWLEEPTKDMKAIVGSKEDWAAAAKKAVKNTGPKKASKSKPKVTS